MGGIGELIVALASRAFLWVGLGIRALLVLLFAPAAVASSYGPFMALASKGPSFDPWGEWMSAGGALDAFPYGYTMVIIFLPLALAETFFSWPAGLGYLFTLLLIDVALVTLLARAYGVSSGFVKAYWLSPIIPIATYIFGFNDLIPLGFLMLGLLLLTKPRPVAAGLCLALAVSSKLTALIALPFLALFFLDQSKRRLAFPAGIAFGLSSLALWMPTFLSPAAQTMLGQNPDWSKVSALALNVDDSRSILLLPLALVFFFYQAWALRRLNSELLFRLVGLGFLILVMLSPASYGWFVLALPLVAAYRASRDKFAPYIVAVFSIQFVLTTLLLELDTWRSVRFSAMSFADPAGLVPPASQAILHTALVALGLVIGLRAWHVLVRRDSFTLLNERPFAIGIAGDSASGKDTLAEAMAGLIGPDSTVKISGDDYHIWDRQKPIWNRITHLNPAANNLEDFGKALRRLSNGDVVRKREYDHETGKLSRELRLRPNHFIVASGLHVLYSPGTRALLDVKVFLDTEETLRRIFKVHRDTKNRGKSLSHTLSSIKNRAADAEKFISPQIDHADIVFRLRPQRPVAPDDALDPAHVPTALIIRSNNILAGYALRRVMIGLVGLHVDLSLDIENDSMTLEVEGDVTGEDIEILVGQVCPEILPLLPPNPSFESGMLGIMQLVLLQQMSDAFQSRISL